MEALYIKGTEDTPEIKFDLTGADFTLSGKSLPENVIAFYKPVLDWIDEFGKLSITDESTFVFKLYYFNTASSKVIQEIILLLNKLFENGRQIKILWYFDTDDEDIIDAGREYKEMVSLPFEMLPY